MTLNAATKAYGVWARENGLVTAKVSRKDEALEWLADEFHTAEDWRPITVKGAILDLVDRFEVAESTARDYCKAFSEDTLGMPLPTENSRTRMFQWLKDHDGDEVIQMKADFRDYATDELGRSSSNINEYWKGYELHLFLMA